jgi:hypothetical protein
LPAPSTASLFGVKMSVTFASPVHPTSVSGPVGRQQFT